MATRLIGYDPDQVPLNSFLSDTAFIPAAKLPLSDVAVAANNAINTTLTDYGTALGNLDASTRPNALPTVSNNFALSRRLDSRFTTTRNLTATYVNALGKISQVDVNKPVFEYDATGKCRGLRVEPSRINMQIQSGNLSAASWGLQGATMTAAARIAPDGTNSMVKLVESATNSEHGTVANTQGPVNAVSVYCYSIFAAAGERRYLRMLLPSAMFGTNMSVVFDLLTGTIVTQPTSPATAGIVPAGNGCWRVWISAMASINGNQNPVQLRVCEVAGTATYTGDGTSGLYIWGGQFELGATPSSYIPTTTVALTRPADVITMPSPLTADVLNPLQGAFVFDILLNDPSGTIAEYNDGTSSNRLILFFDSVGIKWQVFVGGASLGVLGAPMTTGTRFRVACAWGVNSLRISVNGSIVLQGAPSSMPTGLNRLDIGNGRGGTIINGQIISMLTYSKVLSDLELRSLSSF